MTEYQRWSTNGTITTTSANGELTAATLADWGTATGITINEATTSTGTIDLTDHFANSGMPTSIIMNPSTLDSLGGMMGTSYSVKENDNNKHNEVQRFYKQASKLLKIDIYELKEFARIFKRARFVSSKLESASIVREYYGRKVIPIGPLRGRTIDSVDKRYLTRSSKGLRHPIAGDMMRYMDSFTKARNSFLNSSLTSLEILYNQKNLNKIIKLKPWCYMFNKLERRFLGAVYEARDKGVDISTMKRLSSLVDEVEKRIEMTTEQKPTTKFVSEKYKPTNDDVDITDLLEKYSPDFLKMVKSLSSSENKGFRSQRIQLTSEQKRVKKERRKRVQKTRKTNR